ncbi:MAG: hypothetical protein NZ853_09525 [Leptospiraceae bacterium]|nr:hypothetical protein [Leptospiraceae bacterium]MDW7976934.1 hypothetical protein [Leptospiraceae bacterium]
MEHQFSFTLKPITMVCINIKPELYGYLVQNSEDDMIEYFRYLLHKYKVFLLAAKVVHIKGTSTTEYQPPTKDYIRRTIAMDPYLWKEYKELKEMTGYSISAIIRIFLEWEMSSRGERVEMWIPVDFRESLLDDAEVHVSNNYFLSLTASRLDRLLEYVFVDDS